MLDGPRADFKRAIAQLEKRELEVAAGVCGNAAKIVPNLVIAGRVPGPDFPFCHPGARRIRRQDSPVGRQTAEWRLRRCEAVHMSQKYRLLLAIDIVCGVG